MDPSGTATAVWEQDDGTDSNIGGNRFGPGTGWSTATLLETEDAGGASNPQVVLDSSGNATAIWEQSDITGHRIWGNSFR